MGILPLHNPPTNGEEFLSLQALGELFFYLINESVFTFFNFARRQLIFLPRVLSF